MPQTVIIDGNNVVRVIDAGPPGPPGFSSGSNDSTVCVEDAMIMDQLLPTLPEIYVDFFDPTNAGPSPLGRTYAIVSSDHPTWEGIWVGQTPDPDTLETWALPSYIGPLPGLDGVILASGIYTDGYQAFGGLPQIPGIVKPKTTAGAEPVVDGWTATTFEDDTRPIELLPQAVSRNVPNTAWNQFGWTPMLFSLSKVRCAMLFAGAEAGAMLYSPLNLLQAPQYSMSSAPLRLGISAALLKFLDGTEVTGYEMLVSLITGSDEESGELISTDVRLPFVEDMSFDEDLDGEDEARFIKGNSVPVHELLPPEAQLFGIGIKVVEVGTETMIPLDFHTVMILGRVSLWEGTADLIPRVDYEYMPTYTNAETLSASILNLAMPMGMLTATLSPFALQFAARRITEGGYEEVGSAGVNPELDYDDPENPIVFLRANRLRVTEAPEKPTDVMRLLDAELLTSGVAYYKHAFVGVPFVQGSGDLALDAGISCGTVTRTQNVNVVQATFDFEATVTVTTPGTGQIRFLPGEALKALNPDTLGGYVWGWGDMQLRTSAWGIIGGLPWVGYIDRDGYLFDNDNNAVETVLQTGDRLNGKINGVFQNA